MITKGQQVFIKPEWQDAGDHKFTWVAVTDEDDGVVMVSPVDTGLTFAPVYDFKVEWLVDA